MTLTFLCILKPYDLSGFSEVNLDKEKGELEVKAGLKKPGESVLVVKGREIARGQDFQPILNYIVSSHEKVDGIIQYFNE